MGLNTEQWCDVQEQVSICWDDTFRRAKIVHVSQLDTEWRFERSHYQMNQVSIPHCYSSLRRRRFMYSSSSRHICANMLEQYPCLSGLNFGLQMSCFRKTLLGSYLSKCDLCARLMIQKNHVLCDWYSSMLEKWKSSTIFTETKNAGDVAIHNGSNHWYRKLWRRSHNIRNGSMLSLEAPSYCCRNSVPQLVSVSAASPQIRFVSACTSSHCMGAGGARKICLPRILH